VDVNGFLGKQLLFKELYGKWLMFTPKHVSFLLAFTKTSSTFLNQLSQTQITSEYVFLAQVLLLCPAAVWMLLRSLTHVQIFYFLPSWFLLFYPTTAFVKNRLLLTDMFESFFSPTYDEL
jgi:hypothetical protein